MKRTIVLFMAIITVLSVFLLREVYSAEREVTAIGQAAGNSANARKEAVNRALRAAVEKAVGVYVESDTLVKNYQLLEDKIYSKVKGYVKKYDIIEDNKGEGGIYKVKIKAVVADDILKNDLSDLNLIKSVKGNPRIMVLINEYIDGSESIADKVKSVIENEFLKKNFKLVDKSQLKAIKKRDVALSYDDPKKAAALGAKFGAEIVITGNASADFMEKSKPYGVTVYAYSGNVNIRAIKTDTAEIIATDVEEGVARAGGRVLTANKVLEDCAKKAADKLMSKILSRWREEVYNYTDVELIISKVDDKLREDILKKLKTVEGIKEINEKSYGNGVMELEIKIEGAASKVIDRKILKKIDYLKLKSKTPNRIDFEAVRTLSKTSVNITGASVNSKKLNVVTATSASSEKSEVKVVNSNEGAQVNTKIEEGKVNVETKGNIEDDNDEDVEDMDDEDADMDDEDADMDDGGTDVKVEGKGNLSVKAGGVNVDIKSGDVKVGISE